MVSVMADAVLENIAALRDEDWAIREEAATSLGTLRDERAVDPLVTALRDSDRAVRQAAVEALVLLGEPAVPALIRAAEPSDGELQEAALGILAVIGDARALTPLIQALRSPNWIVRSHAAKGLARIGREAAVAPLLPLLQDKVKAVRVEVGLALAALGPAALSELLQALKHPEWLVRLHAVESLGKMKAAGAVDALLDTLRNDVDAAVREDTVRALGEIGDRRATEGLLNILQEPGLRPLAIDALGAIGDPRAVPSLIPIAAGTAQPETSREIAGCGDRWTEEMLAMPAAVKALGLIGEESALPTLVAALHETVTRAEAAVALTRFGAKATPLLLPLLKQTQDENVRYHVAEALAKVGWRAGRLA